jgi:hypothetical protein
MLRHRLPWARWHSLVVIGLGTVWILDGLEWFIGVEAAGKSLEDVAKPLTAHEEETEAPA